MNCPHQNVSPKGKSIHCRLVDIGFPVRNDRCGPCQSEWVDGNPPTIETLTPTLVTLQLSHKGIVERNPRELPPLADRVVAFATAFREWLAGGGKRLPRAERKARRAKCAGCEHRTTFLGADVCGICGCALCLKAAMPKQNCPMKLWPGDKQGCGQPCGSTAQPAKATPATS